MADTKISLQQTDFALPIEIVRTNRKKTASIQICDETIKVTVPKRLSDKSVDDLIIEKSSWITKKIAARQQTPPPKEWVNGETFTYLGRNYRLKLTANVETTKLKNGYLHVPDQPHLNHLDRQAAAKASLTSWYTQQATKKLKQKTVRYAHLMDVQPNSIRVKNYKSRWGSCSPTGDISYNWKIIMAPHRVVDYVVVHELAHLLEHNHSSDYWKHVENVFSDHRERRQWLKQNSSRLEL